MKLGQKYEAKHSTQKGEYTTMFPEILFFVLFPKIFYFLVGILSVFATWCSLLRLHYKYRQSAPQYNTICIGSNNRFGLKSILFKLNAIIF